jgi:cytochrome oxidase Cu insertion factor (SCO1/SenC/PrrC family)
VHGLEKEYQGRIEFVRVNVLRPESEAMIEQYNFNTTPEFYLVDEQGKILGFWSDTTPAEELRQAFDDALY